MLTDQLKPQVVRFITPIAKFLLKLRISPDAITVIGTGLVVFVSYVFISQGRFFAGSLLIAFATLSDLFDGTMARLSNRGASKWGSFLDSTLDRISDSAILVALGQYLYTNNNRLAPIVLVLIPINLLIPYIRAKAESLGIECTGGIAERTERLMIMLAAIFLEGLNVSFALAIGLWILLSIATITVLQRVAIVWRATR